MEAVDCSARGPASALAEDRQFWQKVMTAAGVTPSELDAAAAWKRLAPQIAKVAIGDGLTVEPGGLIDLTVTAGAGVAGRGQMTVRNN